MISYQWDVQKSMIHLKTQLQEQGYKVWMDVDEMGGSTLESMARAVENASVVLVCVSQKYKESPNCRSGSNLHVYGPLHSLASFSRGWRRFCLLSRACHAGYSYLSRCLWRFFLVSHMFYMIFFWGRTSDVFPTEQLIFLESRSLVYNISPLPSLQKMFLKPRSVSDLFSAIF